MNEPIILDLSILLPFIIIQGVLVVLAVFDWIRKQDKLRGNRWVWLAVIVIINTIGPIIYFIFGRRK